MLIERIRNGIFSFKLDELTDISNSFQLIVFVSYRHERTFLENLLFCSALEKNMHRKIFFGKNSMVNGMNLGLCWDNCVSVCTDGTGSILGKNQGLAALVCEVAPHVRFTHSMIHREDLAAKTLPAELNAVLKTATQIVHFIKT